MSTTVSFTRDILATFGKSEYRDPMKWRLDLADYDEVKANADLIYGRISTTDGETVMPPAPDFPALSQGFIDNFKLWLDQGYPR